MSVATLVKKLAKDAGLDVTKQPTGDAFRFRAEDKTVAIGIGHKDGSLSLQVGADIIEDDAISPMTRAIAKLSYGRDPHATFVVDGEVGEELGNQVLELSKRHPRRRRMQRR